MSPVCLVTGAAHGIGKATAAVLLGQGWTVGLFDRDRSQGLSTRNELALRQSRGSIVNIASTRSAMSEPDTFAYSASKGGIVSLTHSLAASLAPDVRVNCVSPGWMDVRGEALRPEDHAQHWAGRVGIPADIGEMVAYLLSPKAGFITGTNMVVDGGMTRKMIYAD